MYPRQRKPGWLAVGVLVLASLPCLGQNPSTPAPLSETGRGGKASLSTAIPLEVREGRCEFTVATPHKGDKYMLVVGSLARGAGPIPVTIRTERGAGPAPLPVELAEQDEAWKQRTQELHDRLAKFSQSRLPVKDYPPAADSLPRREFYLFTKETDFHNPHSYTTITGALHGVGRFCQVYVDRDHADVAGLQPTIDDVIRTFDEDILPRARQSLGRALDVDRDGRFTILLTPWLGKMSNGKVNLGGFVRGSDFYRDLDAPYSNRCDMMYLNTDLKPGPHLRTLLAHEYTHAVIFSEHVFGDYVPEAVKQDEEGWLNEGLAHLAEEMHGYGWSNLDYRVSAFLNDPGRYQLIVPDYYAAGLWRSHGNRGATFLFLRWCADRYGNDFMSRLIQSNLHGTDNLEVTTRAAFAKLFREWTVALAMGGITPVANTPGSAGIHQPLGGRLLCGPRFEEVSLSSGNHEMKLAGTAAGYVLLHSPAGDYSHVTISASPEAELQVTLLPLPEDTGRLHIQADRVKGLDGSVQLTLTAHDADLTLQTAAWERIAPNGSKAEDTNFRPESSMRQVIQSWFGNPKLKAGETRSSSVIALPPGSGDGLIFKVSALDAAGQQVSGWTAVDPAGN